MPRSETAADVLSDFLSQPPTDGVFNESILAPDTVDVLTESNSPVYARIRGKWLKEGVLSKNNNYYSPETVRETVRRTQDRITKGDTPVLILETHDDSGSDRATSVIGRVARVWMNGPIAQYDADIANTSRGRDVAALIMGGFGKPGVSLRADPRTVVTERALHEGKKVRKIHPFEAEGIDFTRRPGLGEYGSIDALTLMESIAEQEVVSLDENTEQEEEQEEKKTPRQKKGASKATVAEKEDKDDGTSTEEDEDPSEGKKERKNRADPSDNADEGQEDEDEGLDRKKDPKESVNTQAELDAYLLSIQKAGYDRNLVAEAIKVADELELAVPRGLREKLTLDVGADRFADFWYSTAYALVEAKAVPFSGLEDYFKDHFSLIERKYSDGAGYTQRDRAAFPSSDYAGRNQTVPIRTEQHVVEAMRLLPYLSDPEGVKRAIHVIAEKKGLRVPESVPMGGAINMTPEELEALIDRKVQERIAQRTALEPEPAVEEHASPHRDHLRSAHDHLASCLGYNCTGDGHSQLGEARPAFNDAQYHSMATAHDNVATVMGMECAPEDTHKGAQRLPADHNPLQDKQAAPRQAKDAFGGSNGPRQGQTVDSGKEMGSAVGEATQNNATLNALTEAVKALTLVAGANQKKLDDMERGLEEAEKGGWRDKPNRKTVINENSVDQDSVELDSLIAMAHDRNLDPRTKLNRVSSLLQQTLGVTDQ